jgi:LmbE family N-acetylglucosaminyl deacetylase
MATKRLLGVFAHPDDENLMSGTLLHYQALGVETGLVYATRGEVGEISDPLISIPANLAEVRETEMRAAAEVLRVQQFWFLGYRDSGMPGTRDNQHLQSLQRARRADVIGKLVAVIRQFQPQVMVTFDEAGGYGHPDHITMYKYATGAFHAAADELEFPELGPAHSVSKLYYSADSRRQMEIMAEWLQAENEEGLFNHVDISQLGLTNEHISVVIDVERWRATMELAASQHRAHKNPNTPLSRLPEELQKNWHNTEYFQLATSRVGADIIGENDLFARVS